MYDSRETSQGNKLIIWEKNQLIINEIYEKIYLIHMNHLIPDM